jgi:hypothetical protein
MPATSMPIIWRLEAPMPAALFQAYATLAGG